MSNFMKIRPVGTELFHVDGRTDMTKLMVAFHNCVNEPKEKKPILIQVTLLLLSMVISMRYSIQNVQNMTVCNTALHTPHHKSLSSG